MWIKFNIPKLSQMTSAHRASSQPNQEIKWSQIKSKRFVKITFDKLAGNFVLKLRNIMDFLLEHYTSINEWNIYKNEI